MHRMIRQGGDEDSRQRTTDPTGVLRSRRQSKNEMELKEPSGTESWRVFLGLRDDVDSCSTSVAAPDALIEKTGTRSRGCAVVWPNVSRATFQS